MRVSGLKDATETAYVKKRKPLPKTEGSSTYRTAPRAFPSQETHGPQSRPSDSKMHGPLSERTGARSD